MLNGVNEGGVGVDVAGAGVAALDVGIVNEANVNDLRHGIFPENAINDR